MHIADRSGSGGRPSGTEAAHSGCAAACSENKANRNPEMGPLECTTTKADPRGPAFANSNSVWASIKGLSPNRGGARYARRANLRLPTCSTVPLLSNAASML